MSIISAFKRYQLRQCGLFLSQCFTKQANKFTAPGRWHQPPSQERSMCSVDLCLNLIKPIGLDQSNSAAINGTINTEIYGFTINRDAKLSQQNA
jgi:hypothetical protein